MAKSDLQLIVELAQRRVRTPEGAKLYGKNIGDLIGEVGAKTTQRRPVTLERLKSIQAQFEAAKAAGNKAAMQDIQEKFTAAVAQFRQSRQDISVLRELTSGRGNQAKSTQRER